MNKTSCWILANVLAILFVADGWGAEHFTWRKKLGGSPYSVGVNPLNPNSVYAQSGTNILVSYNRGNTWSVLGNPGVSQVRQIIVHPADTNIILCVAFTGGLRRSSDYGATWFTVLKDYGVDGESMAYDPHNPDTIFAGNFFTGEVFRSTDRGLYWSSVGFAGGTGLCALAVRPDSANILVAGTSGGTISKSTNGGATWRVVKDGGSAEIPRIVVSEANPTTLYATGYAGAAIGQGIWKSTDGGEQWFRTALHASVWAVDIDYTNPDIVYAGTFGLNNYAAVFGSTNGGASWDTLVHGFPSDGDAWCLKVHPTDPSKVWLAHAGFQVGGIWRWVGTSRFVEGVVLDGVTGDTVRNGSLSVLQTGDSVSLAASAGRFVVGFFDGDTSLNPTLRVLAYPYYVHLEQAGFIPDSGVKQNIFLQELSRGSIAGTVRDSISQQPVTARLTLTASTINGPIAIEDTTDPGGSYVFENVYVSHPPIVQYNGLTVHPAFPHALERVPPLILDTAGVVVHSIVDTADVLVTGPGSEAYTSSVFASVLDSLGLSFHYWDEPRSGLAPLTRARLVRKKTVLYSTGLLDSARTVAQLDSLNACLGSGVNLFISGRNFVERNDSTDFLLNRAHVVYAANSNVSNCRGTPNELLALIPVFSAGAAPKDSMYVISGQAHPILDYSVLSPRGTAAVRVDGDSVNGKLILLGFPFEAIITSAAIRRTILERAIGYFDGSIVVGVDEPLTLPPLEFRLEQNYPNPFNPETNIRFKVGGSGFVRLNVYDVLGREVGRLVNEKLDAGTYQRTFDGSNVAGGVYFYRLQTEGFSATRKLLLVK